MMHENCRESCALVAQCAYTQPCPHRIWRQGPSPCRSLAVAQNARNRACHAQVYSQDKGLSRRTLVGSFVAMLPLLSAVQPASAKVLRSLSSETPCTLTFFNKTQRLVKVYWNNYDADLELFALIPPNGDYTFDSFATHPWSVVDAETGAVLQQYTAEEGFQVVFIQETNVDPSTGDSERLSYSGWDGLGESADAYAPAQVTEVAMSLDGGVASLSVQGFSAPLDIAIGLPEAAALLYASGLESRRPSTLKTWQQSLDAVGASIERVVLTRLVGSTYYSRIVLSMGAGRLTSVDARPSDSLALALQSKKPVFVSRKLARANQEELRQLVPEAVLPGQGEPSQLLPTPLDLLDLEAKEGLQTA